MNDFITMLKTRHSVRSYSDEPVTDEEIQQIVDCAKEAPSAHGAYPLEIKHYQDNEKLDLLSQTQTWSTFIKNAAVCFVIIGYPARSEFWIEDCAVATENILLAAHGLGLGGCWVAVRNMEHENQSASNYVKSVLSLSSDCEVLSMVSVGRLK